MTAAEIKRTRVQSFGMKLHNFIRTSTTEILRVCRIGEEGVLI
jgi:hypothetical protein